MARRANVGNVSMSREGDPSRAEHVVNPRSNYSKKKTRTNASDRKANTFGASTAQTAAAINGGSHAAVK